MNAVKITTLSLVTIAAIALSGCGSSSSSHDSGNNSNNSGGTSYKSAELPADINKDTTLTADTVWLLKGRTVVTNGATLTVEPGTTVAGENPASYLAITQNSKIMAKGTLDKPITFTSKKDVDGESNVDAQGEWGGLILLGNAYAHYTDNTYEADPTLHFGSSSHAKDTESSGDLEYVAVKHTGYVVAKDKELNGLSLGGVGSGTIIKNIAVIGGADDAIEIWGGRPDLTGLYLYNASDDSVDTDVGYRGTWTNVLVQQLNEDSYNDHDSAIMETGNDGDTIVTDDKNATQTHVVNLTGYIYGGGISIKYDGGMILDNVKLISSKTKDEAQVVYRGTDSVTTHAMHVNGCISFKDYALTLTDDVLYSKNNTKIASTTQNAFTDWVTNKGTATGIQLGASASINPDSIACAGVTEDNIWKGRAGSNLPLVGATVTDPTTGATHTQAN